MKAIQASPSAMPTWLQAGLRARERGSSPETAPSRAQKRSGIVLFLDSLTVAGAAPALFLMRQERTGFPFNPGRRARRDT
ncbi:uncharacterized protein sS8_1639 [Methylocaldum marinum]|uniref:Uncharacterized protein n=1 Tax=Methylocaldum marinum TaxID=1432792 RepID=A0A250KPU0_9GAMM|nr:uncharacterized protein sS8_1639 [Methylocaldum marinum]